MQKQQEEYQYICDQLEIDYNQDLYFYSKIFKLSDATTTVSLIILQNQTVDTIDSNIEDYWIKIAQCHILYFDCKELQKKINFLNKEQIIIQAEKIQDIQLNDDFFLHIRDKLQQKKITSQKLMKKEDQQNTNVESSFDQFKNKFQSFFNKFKKE